MLFLCENNSKEGEAQTSRLATKELTAVPRALKIECATVDGGDPEALARRREKALAHVRERQRAVFSGGELVRWPGSHQIVHEFTTGETDVARPGIRPRRRTSTRNGSAPTRSCAMPAR